MSLSRRFHLAPGFARLIGAGTAASPVASGISPDQSDRSLRAPSKEEGCHPGSEESDSQLR